jgi:tetratricopeptide (TPR) repeat protein
MQMLRVGRLLERAWQRIRTLCESLLFWGLGVFVGLAVQMWAEQSGAIRENVMSETQNSMIVFRRADGRVLTMDEIQDVGAVRWELIGASDVPGEAKALHEKGRLAGSSGQYEDAVALFTEACELAPAWPYPVYDRAFTRLLAHDVDGARADYRRTVDLAPRGFFTAITALDALVREQKGELPGGTYLAYLSLEWTNDRARKKELVHQIVERAPRFAPAWKELALLADQGPERLHAIEMGLTAEPDVETRGMLMINKALILYQQGNRESAVRLLGELALDPASTLATEHLSKATLAMIVKK